MIYANDFVTGGCGFNSHYNAKNILSCGWKFYENCEFYSNGLRTVVRKYLTQFEIHKN